jgi:branched-chain amino acid transport system substrate-binding protein
MYLRTLLVSLCAAVGFGTLHAEAADTIKVGFPMPLSGPASVYSQPVLKGTQMYIDEINAKGGVLGKKLELLPRDTKASPDEAVRISRELILKDNVDFLVGTWTSSEAPAVSTIAKENKVLMISPVAKTNQLSDPANLHPYIWRTSTTTDIEGRTAALILSKWPVKRVATFAYDYAYGKDVTNAFVTYLKTLRPDIEIVDQQWTKFGQSDYAAFITAQMAKKPDAVVSSIAAGDFVTFAKQAGPLGYFKALDGHFVGAGDVGSIEVAQTLGADYPYGIIANAIDPVIWPKNEPAAHKEFMTHLQAYMGDKYGSSWSIVGYGAMEALVAAIKKAGSTDTEKVVAAMPGLAFDTPVGTRIFDNASHTANMGEFWGKMEKTDSYPFAIQSPTQYFDPAPFMH